MTDSDYQQAVQLVVQLASMAHLVELEGAIERIREAKPAVVALVPTRHTPALDSIERMEKLMVALRPFKAEADQQIAAMFGRKGT